MPLATPSVYLAGPITGLSYLGATDWREDAIKQLADVGIKGINPMRAKEYLADITELRADCQYGDLSVMSSPRGIMTRDRWDATRCDVLLVNLFGAERISLGTMMEVAWADLSRIPIVCVMEEGNVHEHAMLAEAIGFRVPSLTEALHIVKAMFS